MNNKITFSKRFRKRMKSINKNRYYLQKNFYDMVLSKFENLKYFPNMYPKLENSDYRKIPIKNYIILYIILKEEIRIINIISTKSSYYNELY